MTDELTPSQYVVLGLIARNGPMTPYELKGRIEQSVENYWPIPHAQLYRDPPRLAELGLLTERAEEHGRRRRVFHLTDAGREALHRWLADPTSSPPETRNPALLKLTFTDLASPAEVAALARTQAARHRQWADAYRQRLADLDPADPATASRTRLLELGIRHEQNYVDFWETLAAESA
ncbi:PadR family transcriptional regulator [Streptomyces netropsis]|uniref:DNA-binding PadR family transcriptional regulator n=1 Tax=Streptomyces netropsis TaxID=55404 RepID=A0A7W7LHW0_STRNE|nr:PadR family transcriptional regulator [Streptomyces netropsis]MBB4890530.1 DNA-binding PadR family transcriptional regulator [Streptomyces netropsis]